MNNRYHLSKNGEINICNAEISCPLGGFHGSYEQLEKYVEIQEEAKRNFEFIQANFDSTRALEMLNITTNEGNKTEYEALIKLAQEENKSIGIQTPFQDDSFGEEPYNEQLKKAAQLALGQNVQPNFINLILETEDNFYIWPRTTNNLDLQVIKKADLCSLYKVNDNTVTSIEVKDLSKKAQLPKHFCNRDETGVGLALPLNKNIQTTEELTDFISSWDSRLDSYRDTIIPLTRKEGIEYLVNEYVRKGAKELIFKDKQGELQHISFHKDNQVTKESTQEAVNLIHERNIDVKVTIRANNTDNSRKVSESDKQTFLDNYGSMFKDGVAKEVFMLSELKTGVRVGGKAYVNKDNENGDSFIRLGDFWFKSKTRLKKGVVYNINDFSRCIPTLTGYMIDKTKITK